MKRYIALVIMVLISMSNCVFTGNAEQIVTVGSVITFGKYEQDGNINNGAEPIQWKVLEIQDSKALVISVNGLEAISYSKAMDIKAYDDRKLSWETSYLRSWLNKDFLNEAFTADEKKGIVITKIENNDAYGIYTTEDAVFCLSITEADKFFNSNASMACTATTAAKNNLKINQGAITDEGYCVWWLRDLTSAATPQYGFNFMSVKGNEAGMIGGTSGTTLAKSEKGMPVFIDYLCTARPAMWIKLQK